MFYNKGNPYDQAVDPYSRRYYRGQTMEGGPMQIPSRGALSHGAASLIPRNDTPPSPPTSYQATGRTPLTTNPANDFFARGGGQQPLTTAPTMPREHDFWAAGGQAPGAAVPQGAAGGEEDLFSRMLGGGQGDIFQRYMQQALAKLEAEEKEGKGYEMPYYEAGGKGLQAYMASLGLGAGGGQGVQSSLDTFRQSPGYKFALQQAQEAGQRGMAAAGMTGSGAAAAEMQRRAQGAAEQEYGGYQRQLAGLAGMGERTAGALGQLGLGYAGDIAGVYGALGKGEMEKKLAEEQMEAQKSSGFWGALGKIGGAILGGPGGIISRL